MSDPAWTSLHWFAALGGGAGIASVLWPVVRWVGLRIKNKLEAPDAPPVQVQVFQGGQSLGQQLAGIPPATSSQQGLGPLLSESGRRELESLTEVLAVAGRPTLSETFRVDFRREMDGKIREQLEAHLEAHHQEFETIAAAMRNENDAFARALKADMGRIIPKDPITRRELDQLSQRIDQRFDQSERRMATFREKVLQRTARLLERMRIKVEEGDSDEDGDGDNG